MRSLAAAALIAASLIILPTRLYPLHVAFAALVGLAVLRERRQQGKGSLAGQALVRIGLSWLAGHLAFGPMSGPSLALALCFTLAAWGAWRVAADRVGLWLLNGGQAVGLALLAAVKQPLVVGGLGLLLFGQVALQLPLPGRGDPGSLVRRTWPWLMAAMMVAAFAI
jgi:hypothetical protein